MYDVIIIGGGPAGLTASIYASRAGLTSVVFEKMFVGGQVVNTYEVDNYPGFESINGVELVLKLEAHAKKFGVKVINEEVTEMDVTGEVKSVLTSGGTYQGKTIIITAGAYPRKLEIPGEDLLRGRGVSYCATCDGAFYRGKDVAVIGGGNTAVEDAIFLSRFCRKVYLIHRRNEFRAQKQYHQRLYEIPSIELVLEHVPVNIHGQASVEGITVSNVKTGEEKELAVNGVFIAVGTVPDTAFAEGVITRDKNGAIITNQNMETNILGVYAAGDARNTPLRQIVTAASDGAVAAFTASNYIAGHMG